MVGRPGSQLISEYKTCTNHFRFTCQLSHVAFLLGRKRSPFGVFEQSHVLAYTDVKLRSSYSECVTVGRSAGSVILCSNDYIIIITQA